MDSILVLNAGSSSVKFALYDATSTADPFVSGQVENIGADAHLLVKGSEQTFNVSPSTHLGAINAIIRLVESKAASVQILGIGHRIVHGGTRFSTAVELNTDTLTYLHSLSNLAPLHQPHNLKMVEVSKQAFPNALQVGCFDTAFHHGHPWVNDTFAIPNKYYDEGIRRYGFHGLSYEYIASQLPNIIPSVFDKRIIVAHLGNGASMCGLNNLKSIVSSMGFSALDGLPMGTRCGQIDAGVLLFWMDKGYSKEKIERIVYKESGLKGLSGMTNDVRMLLASDDPHAKRAIDYFVNRITREIGSLSAVLGGLDALVFTGGIGENAAKIRELVIEPLSFLGLKIDTNANASNQTFVQNAKVPICVIPTKEESVIARAVALKLRQ